MSQVVGNFLTKANPAVYIFVVECWCVPVAVWRVNHQRLCGSDGMFLSGLITACHKTRSD